MVLPAHHYAHYLTASLLIECLCKPHLQDYKAAQKVAAEKEAQFLPKVPPAASPSALAASSTGSTAAAAAAEGSEADIENQALLQEQRLIESRAMDNTITFQEALIEERDHGIQGMWAVCLFEAVPAKQGRPFCEYRLGCHLVAECDSVCVPS